MDLQMRGRAHVRSYRDLMIALREVGRPSLTHADAWALPDKSGGYLCVRHDVDHDIDTALKMARIEHEEGIHASYYLLAPGDYDKTDNYYGKIIGSTIYAHAALADAARELVALGHEVGLHNDFLQLSAILRRPVAEILAEEIAWFRSLGVPLVGTASHGSSFARRHGFTNYEIFREWLNPKSVPRRIECAPDWAVDLYSVGMEALGLQYEAYRLPREVYVSDTGSSFVVERVYLEEVSLQAVRALIGAAGKVVALIHADWWTEPAPAAASVAVPAAAEPAPEPAPEAEPEVVAPPPEAPLEWHIGPVSWWTEPAPEAASEAVVAAPEPEPQPEPAVVAPPAPEAPLAWHIGPVFSPLAEPDPVSAPAPASEPKPEQELRPEPEPEPAAATAHEPEPEPEPAPLPPADPPPVRTPPPPDPAAPTMGDYAGLLALLKARGDVDFITYDDLCWEDDTDYPGSYPDEWSRWKARVRAQPELAARVHVLIQHDTDSGPAETLAMAQLEADFGIRSSIMTFARKPLRVGEPAVEDYDIDWAALRSLQHQGFCVGYHCNALHLAHFDADAAPAAFSEDLAHLRHHGLKVDFFTAHGGKASPTGLTNAGIDYPALLPLAPRWVNTRYSPRFDGYYSDGGSGHALSGSQRLAALRDVIAAMQPGCRYRLLIHAQYFAPFDSEPAMSILPPWPAQARVPAGRGGLLDQVLKSSASPGFQVKLHSSRSTGARMKEAVKRVVRGAVGDTRLYKSLSEIRQARAKAQRLEQQQLARTAELERMKRQLDELRQKNRSLYERTVDYAKRLEKTRAAPAPAPGDDQDPAGTAS